MKYFVHKFGGASVSTSDLIRNAASIFANHISPKSLVVVSAIGKTTNKLEKVTQAIYSKGDYLAILDEVRTQHFAIVNDLFEDPTPILDSVNDILAEVDWIADEENSHYDYVYDQVVGIGELLSSLILSQYLSLTQSVTYLDVRDCLVTDQTYRDAIVDWTLTQTRIESLVKPKFESSDYIVTQGYIGVDDENNTTTLGREGSDYTASIFGKCLGAESVTVWKDVPGILSADPKQFEFAEMLPALSYDSLYTLADAGAKVIHPKTILPLKSAGIPLQVKSFNAPSDKGTLISADTVSQNLPSVVCKDDQLLITLSPSQFDDEWDIATIVKLFKQENWDINYFQKNALKYVICVRYDYSLMYLIDRLKEKFDVTTTRDVRLITIINTDDAIEAKLVGQDEVLLMQRSERTYKAVLRS